MWQHLKGSNRHTSLVFSMVGEVVGFKLKRNKALKNAKYLPEFESARDRIAKWNLSVLEIADPVELYLLEVYASLKLKTKYNFFEAQ
ncbi:hypothetical protein CH375_07390 [Leptospira ellisii]|uniref:Uncharacterized protein n=1 Tax=Leptospira ellisii TaxID=2023197 RepID=A0A2N0BM17_9LEPT|nr:hypothetical protein CH379_18575 [Leptospira ellisii]PKA05043.1 hypothetical protein CH375_07390 [Leptospira ellisii]